MGEGVSETAMADVDPFPMRLPMLGEGDGEVAVLLLVQGEDHEVLDGDFANGLELGRRNDGLLNPAVGGGEVLGQNVA